MKMMLSILILVHGCIHLLGFVKAFHLASVNQLTLSVSKFSGILWLFTAVLFVASALLLFLKKDSW